MLIASRFNGKNSHTLMKKLQWNLKTFVVISILPCQQTHRNDISSMIKPSVNISTQWSNEHGVSVELVVPGIDNNILKCLGPFLYCCWHCPLDVKLHPFSSKELWNKMYNLSIWTHSNNSSNKNTKDIQLVEKIDLKFYHLKIYRPVWESN